MTPYQQHRSATKKLQPRNGVSPIAARNAKTNTKSGAKSGTDAKNEISLVADMLSEINECLEDNKAEDMTTIDLQGKTSLADYMVIASGRSQRHVGALADHLARSLKKHGFGKAHLEGLPQADWVLIDAGDIIVHLFRPEVREFYNLEKMWSPALIEEEEVAS